MKSAKKQSIAVGFVISVTLTVIVATDILIAKAHAIDDSNDLKKRLYQEAPIKWNEYCVKIANIDMQGVCRVISRSKIIDGGVNIRDEYGVWTYELRRNANAKMLITSMHSKTTKETTRHEVICVNPLYFFYLQRSDSGRPWVLLDASRAGAKPIPQVPGLQLKNYEKTSTALIEIDGKKMADLLKSREFNITKCHAIRQDGRELIEVSFSNPNQVDLEKIPYSLVQSGTIIMDPENYWTIRSAKYLLGPNYNKITGTSEVVFHIHTLENTGLPYAKNIDVKNEFSRVGFKNQQSITYENEMAIPSALPADTEFTLTAFGLTEPPGLEWHGSGSRWYLWGMGAAGGCLVLLILFQWLKRRKLAQAA